MPLFMLQTWILNSERWQQSLLVQELNIFKGRWKSLSEFPEFNVLGEVRNHNSRHKVLKKKHTGLTRVHDKKTQKPWWCRLTHEGVSQNYELKNKHWKMHSVDSVVSTLLWMGAEYIKFDSRCLHTDVTCMFLITFVLYNLFRCCSQGLLETNITLNCRLL